MTLPRKEFLASEEWRSPTTIQRSFRQHKPFVSSQRGTVLLEVLISILLFAIGVLSFIGFQARFINNTADIGGRAEVARLTGAYIAQMWTSSADIAALQNKYENGSDAYKIFVARVADALPKSNPTVSVSLTPSGTPAKHCLTTVVVTWTDRVSGATHRFQQMTGIGS